MLCRQCDVINLSNLIAHPRLHVLFSIYFSLCYTHGYMPADMMETTIVPIIKNICDNLEDSNN